VVSSEAGIKTFFENGVSCYQADGPTGNMVLMTFAMIDPINHKTLGVQRHAIANPSDLDSEVMFLETQFLESLFNLS